jgi:hypothetical protein
MRRYGSRAKGHIRMHYTTENVSWSRSDAHRFRFAQTRLLNVNELEGEQRAETHSVMRRVHRRQGDVYVRS